MAVLIVCYFQQMELSKLRTAEIEMISPETGDTIKITNKDLLNMVYHYGKETDSLYDELFQAKVQNGRYELSLEHLYEVNPKAGKQFTEFMEHETE